LYKQAQIANYVANTAELQRLAQRLKVDPARLQKLTLEIAGMGTEFLTASPTKFRAALYRGMNNISAPKVKTTTTVLPTPVKTQ